MAIFPAFFFPVGSSVNVLGRDFLFFPKALPLNLPHRFYFVAPHHGEPPSWFRFADTAGAGQLSLGTWKKTKRPIFVRVRRPKPRATQ